MANWQHEISKRFFCLNMNKTKEIVLETDNISVPKGKNEAEYKYDKAHAQIKAMIMAM